MSIFKALSYVDITLGQHGATDLKASTGMQIVEKREAPLLGSRVTESEDFAL